MRILSVGVVLCTLLLVIAGGLVTSNDASLAIPDWPLAWGKLIPPLEGGIRFAFAHRVLAGLVAVMTVTLAVWSRRRLAWAAAGAVLLQAVLGGLAVRLAAPTAVSIAHAALAQVCFGLVVAVAVGLYSDGRRARPAHAAVAVVAALFVQTLLGAGVRYEAIGVAPHIAGALVSTLIVMWVGLGVLSRQLEEPARRRVALLLLSLTISQVFLGMGAYAGRLANADAPQPLPLMIWFTVAHVAAGALALGAAVALAAASGREVAAA